MYIILLAEQMEGLEKIINSTEIDTLVLSRNLSVLIYQI